ncbi:MAG TPA: LytR C-terminal domain-containing protein, partial [Pseudonocardia sp.]|nr:LytR C-terminal domain-containing protein [Pseudonocardia sp.]
PGAPGQPGAPGADSGSGSGGGSGGGTGAGGVAGSGSGDTRSGTARGALRVYNNSTITGLASSAADDFRNAGWQVDEVSNYPFGIISSSTVYYRPGTPEKATADDLGAQFGLRVHERFPGLEGASPGVIVIVTNDYQGL